MSILTALPDLVSESSSLHPHPTEMASQANLIYVGSDHPGYTRVKRGRGFAYTDTQGRYVREAELLGRVQALAIPPAWTEVWICADPDGHIQATGRDEKGRKQYIYHSTWAEVRDSAKYNRLLPFAEALPALRAQVDADLRKRALSWEKVAALAIDLLDKTRIRIGNPEYQRQNESYGLTTLQDQHVDIAGDRITFSFQGKSGKDHTVELRDRRLARLVRQCQDLPGQELFQYLDDEGMRRTLRSNDVNQYLREITGQNFSAKDFRTWGGTVTTTRALFEAGPAATKTERKRKVAQAVRAAAKALGNTVSVCRKYYIHPAILTAYADGELFGVMEEAQAAAEEGLYPDETAVRALLRQYAERDSASPAVQAEVQETLAEGSL
jgi:DNA topoisomerase-1